MASGEWRVASGEWRVASGEWRVASGEWRVASGEWSCQLLDRKSEMGMTMGAGRFWGDLKSVFVVGGGFAIERGSNERVLILFPRVEEPIPWKRMTS